MSHLFACGLGRDMNPLVEIIFWLLSLLFHFPLVGIAVTIAAAMYAVYLFMEA